MRLVITRVFEGWVSVEGAEISRIKQGLLVLVGLTASDNKDIVDHMISKTLNIRLWNNKEGKSWASSVMDIEGEILAVSQFTLYAKMKGNKPDFHSALQADEAKKMFDYYV